MRLRSLLFLLILLPFYEAAAQTTPCVCSGFNSSRTDSPWSFVDGSVFSRALRNLRDPAFFGPSGVVDRQIAIGGGMQVATAPTLSGVDIFFTGLTRSSTFAAAERTALTNAVNNGMNMVVTSDDPEHSIADLFGVTLAADGEFMNRSVLTEHPILAGPFGRIVQFRGADPAASYRSWPAGTLLMAASDAGASFLLIPRGTLAPSAGAVLLISDVDILTTYLRDEDPNTPDASVPVTDALVMNIVAFLCNPSAPASAPHLVFPQIANGEGTVSTLNLTNSDGSSSVAATIAFREDDGSAYSLNLMGRGAASTFTVGNVRSNETISFVTDGVGPLKSGTATVRGSSPLLGGNVIFFTPGIGVTSVGASGMAGGFVMPVVAQPAAPTSAGGPLTNVRTGVAISNLSAKTTSVLLELWDASRRSDGVRTIALGPRAQTAEFLSELFPNFDFNGFTGTLRIVSGGGLIAATAIQMGNSVGQFTALPVTPVYR
jgi:hypothetical protein